LKGGYDTLNPQPLMKALFISRSPPYPTTIGGNQRSHLFYQALRRIMDVDLLLAASEEECPADHVEVLRASFGLVGMFAPRLAGENGF
jgi:hypothetical protein